MWPLHVYMRIWNEAETWAFLAKNYAGRNIYREVGGGESWRIRADLD